MKNIGIVALLFLQSCQSPTVMPSPEATPATAAAAPATATTETPQPKDTSTLGGTWYLQPVLASDTAAGKIPWLKLNLAASRFTGNTGCNSMHGKFWFSSSDSSLSFDDKLGLSKMACTGYNEPAFLKSLGSTTHYTLHNGTLTLIGNNRAELSRWIRQPAALPKALKT